ncbi:hypothetical protein ILUMI_06924 [Ignelater luminosus]|uniref:Uncharacterized protein n=1 Tax=Ignelater luminosus TaxID=2038154 RepID=A0A8K0GHA8_IGNLU|nr:hypothetical protein ILUMI_06924 [Ignelater luminosus]
MSTHKLAYKYATKLQKKSPVQQYVDQMAGIEWMSTGSWPINRLIFTDENFLGAYATDGPDSEIKADLSPNMSLITVEDKTLDPSPNHTNNSVHNDIKVGEAFTSKMENPSPTIYEDKDNIRPMMRPILNEIIDSATRTPINIISVQIIKPAGAKPIPKAGARKTNRKSGLDKLRVYTSSLERAKVEELEKSMKLKLEKTDTKHKQRQ